MYVCATCTLFVTHVCTYIGGSQRVPDTIIKGMYAHICTYL